MKKVQIIHDPWWTFRDLVQFTPCPPIHGGIASIIPMIQPMKVRIQITTIWRAIVDAGIIIQQEVKVVDMDIDMGVDMVPTMLLAFPIHS